MREVNMLIGQSWRNRVDGQNHGVGVVGRALDSTNSLMRGAFMNSHPVDDLFRQETIQDGRSTFDVYPTQDLLSVHFPQTQNNIMKTVPSSWDPRTKTLEGRRKYGENFNNHDEAWFNSCRWRWMGG